MVHKTSLSIAFWKRITSFCTIAVLFAVISLNAAGSRLPQPTPKVALAKPQAVGLQKTENQSPWDLANDVGAIVPDASISEPVSEETNDPDSRENILSLVNPIEVDAFTNSNTDIYVDTVKWEYITTLAKDTKVKLLRDKGEKFALVRLKDGRTGWIKYSALRISNTDYAIKEDLSEKQKNLFVNYKGYASDTKYLVWVNLERQRVNVYQGSKDNWKLSKSMVCSSGKNSTPTINGEFKYYQLHSRINFDDYYVVDFMRYYDTFAIHSIPFNFNNKPYDDTLGTPNSHGCIRVSYNDIKWLSGNIPKNTKIVVF